MHHYVAIYKKYSRDELHLIWSPQYLFPNAIKESFSQRDVSERAALSLYVCSVVIKISHRVLLLNLQRKSHKPLEKTPLTLTSSSSKKEVKQTSPGNKLGAGVKVYLL